MKNLEQEIARVTNTPGVYLISDSKLPRHPITGAEVYVVVISTGHGIHAINMEREPLDPNRFFETVTFHGPLLPR